MLFWRIVAAGVTAGIGITMSATAAGGATVVDEWSMTVHGNKSANLAGGAAMDFHGPWSQVEGQVGQAVRFDAAPSYGVASGTEGQNPGSEDFAMGESFTSNAIPNGYSGNLMQKGLFGDSGQVKLQLVPANGGTVNCRIKGNKGAKIVGSAVVVDDGRWHTATCWRESARVGLTVDGATTTTTWSPGTIANSRAIRVGNKSDSADWTDQHFGAVDCSTYVLGYGARAAVAATLPC